MSNDPIAWLGTQQDAMVALLRELVDIDSNSYDKPGIDAVGAAIARFLDGHGITVETLAQKTYGDCLRASVPGTAPPANERPNVMLLGHRDTVFPTGTVAQRPFSLRDGLAHGPGVADMKAGLVMNCFVLAAYAQAGGATRPLVGLFTGDEEIGSPEGRDVITAEARHACAVFNSEPGRASGNIVTGRKGGAFFRLRVLGKAAHSGGAYTDGISAIEALARKISAIHALTDLARGITLNVGLIRGGQSVNTVAPWAEAEIDLRYVDPADRPEMGGRLQAITDEAHVAGTTASLEVRGEFVPMTQTPDSQRLFDTYVAAASASGFTPSGEFSGGCADSGFTTAAGAATVCGVGPVGGKGHTDDEFLRIDTLVPRAQACARAVAAF